MPNISGQYNFNELCLKAQASAPWVKKVQRFLNLGEGEGIKGARSYYSEEQVHIYSIVKKLRLIDIEFDEIKHLAEIEKKIGKFGSVVPVSSLTNPEHLTYISMIFLPSSQVLLFVDGSLRNHREEFEKLFVEYTKMRIYVMTKAKSIKVIAEEVYSNIENTEKTNELKILQQLGP
ncbi:MAG: hypothetical protein NT088_03015 [Candidatus Omnitrophica bacterium]|nr:hypothetical protein [Candidatus Omnitrophota bacterium]